MTPDPVEEDRARWIELGWEQPDAMACFMSINRAQKQLVDRVHVALRPHGVTIIENSCLLCLAMADGHRQPLSRIAERLLIGAGRCNYIINSLEERGLVRREPHPSDGRVTLAVATRAGLRLVAAANRDLADIRFGLEDVDADTITDLITALAAIREPCDRRPSDGDGASGDTGPQSPESAGQPASRRPRTDRGARTRGSEPS